MEKIDKRFGQVAVEIGIITREQLIEAMQAQILEELKGARYRLVGEILRDEGYITDAQIDEVIESMSSF